MNKGVERPTENWTRFPNCILDNIDKYTPTEIKVLAFMIRKNEGYQNPNKQFGLNYISSKINMSKPTTNTAIKGLLNKGAIAILGTMNKCNCYDILWVEPRVKNFNRLKSLPDNGKKIKPLKGKNINPVLDNKVKENKVLKKKVPFKPPLLEELTNYVIDKDLVYTDPKDFIKYWEINEWVNSKGKKMKDWKKSVKLWDMNQKKWGYKPLRKPPEPELTPLEIINKYIPSLRPYKEQAIEIINQDMPKNVYDKKAWINNYAETILEHVK